MDNHLSGNAPDPLTEKSLPVPTSVKAKYQDHIGSARTIKVQSLSRGGICVEDNVRLPVGTALRLLLNVKGKTIEAQGEVAWNSRAGSSFLHGIKFTFMEQEGRQWFNTFIMDWAAELIAQDLDFSALTQAQEAERRSFARLKIPLRIEFGFNAETMLIQTQIFDLSEGGLCLISNFEIKKGQELYLKLWLSDAEFIPLIGIVKYCVKKVFENRNVNFHGLEFTQLDEPAKEKLCRFLKQKRSELAAIEISLDDIVGQTQLPELP